MYQKEIAVLTNGVEVSKIPQRRKRSLQGGEKLILHPACHSIKQSTVMDRNGTIRVPGVLLI